MLTDPVSFGGRAEDAFDVIVPDLPGYGFSDKPKKAGMLFHVNDLWARLMVDTLGYQKFGAHGGDWGSTVTEQLARSHPDSVVAIHLTDVPFGHLFQKPDDPSPAEEKFFKRTGEWIQKEGAYALIQSTKPESLAPGLNDSPAGLAAWMIEKFRAWSDCRGNIESRFTKNELLTHIMIYWATESIGTSFLPYYDYSNAGALTWIKEGLKNWVGSCKVPAAFALFPKDISHPPREWAERFFKVQRWTEMSSGGHFAAMKNHNCSLRTSVLGSGCFVTRRNRTSGHPSDDFRSASRHRESSQIQFTSQVLPPSGENDCSMRADCGEMFSHM
jgi:microsomal epoxide hydrolase